MLVSRKSTYSGILRTRDLDVAPEQLQAWVGGELIQNAMPQLSDADRKFIMTGMTQEEWDEMCKEDDNEQPRL